MYLSEAASRLDLHRNTLLQYEKFGLVEPDREPGNNYRVYDQADLEWIQCLHEMIHQEGYQRQSLARILEITDCWTMRNCSRSRKKSCKWFQKIKEDEHA